MLITPLQTLQLQHALQLFLGFYDQCCDPRHATFPAPVAKKAAPKKVAAKKAAKKAPAKKAAKKAAKKSAAKSAKKKGKK